MKDFFLVFCISFAAVVMANAQDYEKFKVGFGSGFTLKEGENVADGGIIFMFEPAFHLIDDIVLGVRCEFADTNLDLFYGGYQVRSFGFNGQYYFGTNKFRPQIGAGFGWFTISAYVPPFVPRNTKFGFYPRIGFDVGHFFLIMEYNLIKPSESVYLDEIGNNYFGCTIGFFAGGGKLPSKQPVE